MALALRIKQRLLLSHLFAAVVLAGAFGAFVYYTAEQQLVERLRAQLSDTAASIARSVDPASLDVATSDAIARHDFDARLQAEAGNHHDIELIYLIRDDTGGPHLVASSAEDAAHTPLLDKAGDISARVPVPARPDYLVGIEMSAGEVGEKLEFLRLSAVLAFLVCVLAALVLSRILASRFLTRITDLAARCRALASNEPLPPRRPGPRDEMDDLAREFDAMAGRLRHTAESREKAAAALREANALLESRVRERTAELEGANAKLKNEIESRVHTEHLLAEAALTDPLTALLNRRAMMEMLEQAAAELRPGEQGLSIIVADVDDFKRVNDQYGHAAGDRVLAAVAAKLRELSGGHQQHNVARWGGEEFLVLLPNVRLAVACKRAEQLRREVAAMRIEETVSVSISLGVAEMLGGESPDACLRRCDQAMYRAKACGRNAVVAAQGALFATMS
jgi:diguanylate cyclase (GGDEF)-like protein